MIATPPPIPLPLWPQAATAEEAVRRSNEVAGGGSFSVDHLLKAGHEDPTIEDVLETHDSYVIVEKEGVEVERVAKETDPRDDE
jgi:hypothetical protein